MDKIATEKALEILKQALNDKIAQHYIDVADPLFTTITDAEKAEIKKHLVAGDLKNCLLRCSANGSGSLTYTEYAQIVNWVHNSDDTGFIVVQHWLQANPQTKKITIGY